jgi:hypothetical protein
MIMFGVDAHKRSHTIVAVDDLGKQVATITVGTTTSVSPGRVGVVAKIAGEAQRRWAVEDCRHLSGGWSGTCWRPASSWCGCRRS